MSSPDPASTLTALMAVDVSAVDADACARLLGDTKLLRGWLDAFEAKITRRADQLHEQNGAAPASDLHTRCGGVSSAEGKRKQRRSKTLDDAPSFADALASGDIGAEHVDALANATARLDNDIKDQLLDREDDLLDDARNMTPEQFGRSCNELARGLEHDHGIERNRRQRNQTYLSRKLNARSGMVEGRFALHPELANQIFGPVDRHVATLITEGEQAGDPDCADRTVDRNRLAAEALGDLVAAGNHHLHPGTADITVIVNDRTIETGELDTDSVCETSDGNPLPPASIQRLICGGNITPLHIDANGNPLDAGRTIRHANRRQRRALRALHRTCAFHGCDITFDRCEIHHLPPDPTLRPESIGRRPDRPDQPDPALQPPPPHRPRTRLVTRTRHPTHTHHPTTRQHRLRHLRPRRPTPTESDEHPNRPEPASTPTSRPTTRSVTHAARPLTTSPNDHPALRRVAARGRGRSDSSA